MKPYEVRALTLTQPWASLVAWGEKRIETRDWGTIYRGPLAIHAAKSFPRWAVEACFAEPFRSVLAAHVEYLQDLPLGAIVAVAELVDCARIAPNYVAGLGDQERAFGDYTPGRIAWELSSVRPLSQPIRARGSLGLWVPESQIVEALEVVL